MAIDCSPFYCEMLAMNPPCYPRLNFQSEAGGSGQDLLYPWNMVIPHQFSISIATGFEGSARHGYKKAVAASVFVNIFWIRKGLGWTWVDYSHGSAIARRRQVPMPAMQNTPWPRAWTRHGMAMGCHGMFWRWLNMAEKWSKSPLLVDNLVGYLWIS